MIKRIRKYISGTLSRQRYIITKYSALGNTVYVYHSPKDFIDRHNLNDIRIVSVSQIGSHDDLLTLPYTLIDLMISTDVIDQYTGDIIKMKKWRNDVSFSPHIINEINVFLSLISA